MVQVDKYRSVLQTGLLVLWVRLLLHLTSLPVVLNQLSRGSRMGNPDDAEMKKMAYYVDRWLRLFPYNQEGNCFPRSLALYRLARRRGFPVRFHCGVKKGVSGLEGHAWLTLESKTVYEPGAFWRDFTVTFSYPPDSVTHSEVLGLGVQACNRWAHKQEC
ncbi:MAG: lasso peptide biosynthesis B2 protein [Nitrospira sp.]|nr:lasso peptide biosynthesis B2 protein [Nitrospira sp.]